MKGTLHKTETRWVVRYKHKTTGLLGTDASYDEELPLHPDNIKDAVEGKEVEWEEFEIYIGRPDKNYASAGLYKFAKLIIPKQQESWETILSYYTKGSAIAHMGLEQWLIDNYHPPEPIKK